MAFGGQEGVVALVVRQRHRELVQGQVAARSPRPGRARADRSGLVMLIFSPAIGEGAREVGAELVSQGRPGRRAAAPCIRCRCGCNSSR